jgi:O-antigen/teichoic acid export membrane protein
VLIRATFAHLSGRVASLAAGLVTIPLVTMTLGTEALGLVGAYVTLQGMMGLLDLGLPMATNHQLAVLVSRSASRAEKAVFIRSVEILFWALAISIFLTGILAHQWIAGSWFKVENLSHDTVSVSLVLIVASVAIRFPVAFYSSVLFGLGRHGYPNFVIAASAGARILVALVALTEFGAGLIFFFIIQLAFSLSEVALLAAGTWYRNECWLVAPRWKQVQQIAKTSSLLTAVSLIGVALAQLDKIILSSRLSLGDFGVYVAAHTLASGLLALSYPVGNAVFPQLSGNLARKSYDAVARLVRLGAEMTILLIIPIGAVVVMQSQAALDLLFLVRPVPDGLAAILSLMMLGGMAHALATLPHMFQVATGKPSILFWINAMFLIPYGVLVLVLTKYYGVWGGALAFLILNVARLCLYWATMLARPSSAFAWRSIPLLELGWCAGALATAGLIALWPAPKPTNMLVMLVSIVTLALIAAVALPASRRKLLRYVVVDKSL